MPHRISNSGPRWHRATALVAILAAVMARPATAGADAAPPPSENAPLRFVVRAAEMRAETFRASRAAAEAAMQQAEAGRCGPVVQRRSAQYREIVASADETAAKAAATVESNPGKAASGYVQADKILQRLLGAATTWQCGDRP